MTMVSLTARLLLSVVLPLGLPLLPARASPADPAPLLELSLEDLQRYPVITASRHEQPLWRAPAIVSVLDGEDLRRQGYRSVAEALRTIPGIHVINDGVSHYVIVRGIDSGMRAYGRTVKVMLDGQPLGLRSDASQLLGPELLPLSSVQRIEVVLGAASALYGADAYLGVINIITRPSATTPSSLSLAAGTQPNSAHGTAAELVLSHDAAPWSVLVAGSLAAEDRGEQTVPLSSPAGGQLPDTHSRDDHSRPAALYARFRRDDEAFRHTLALQLSRLDSDGEFLDFGTLSHDSRLALRQQTLWGQSEWQAAESQRYQARLAYAWGEPDTHEQLSLGTGSNYPAREFGYRAWEAALEGQHAGETQHLVWGVDGSWDEEELMEVFSVDRSTGVRTQVTPAQPTQLFRNLGAYLQYQWQPAAWDLALNWRHDRHNIYGDHNSYRLGLAGQLRPELTGKLLYGTAFKAPNAFQLHTQPLYAGEILGNAALTPEDARTLEGQLSWQARPELLLTLTAYHLQVRRLIQLQPFGVNQRWDNSGEQRGDGLQTELHWRPGAHELSLSSAWQDTVVRPQIPLLPQPEVPTASAPRLQAQLDWGYHWSRAQAGVQGRYIGPRRASDSNIALNLNTAYQLPAYTVWRLHGWQQWSRHQLGASLDNALDKRYAEPGYGGIDLPGPRRRLWLHWTWSY